MGMNTPQRDAELERQIAERVSATLNHCFENCERAMRDLAVPGMLMVMGGAYFAEGATYHAWLELDGVVIDPTCYLADAYPIYYDATEYYTLDQIEAIRTRDGGFFIRE